LTVILDTNPAAWSLLSQSLPFSSVVANLLVFVNAHLACNYTNKVAIIASHCDKAQYLYPTPSDQPSTKPQPDQRPSNHQQNGTSTPGNKYRPFRLIETEVLSNLTTLLTATSSNTVQTSTTTMIAGALSLALSYINRESIAYTESLTGAGTNNPTANRATHDSNKIQSRILLVTASPSTDLAHQYIPIMNAIFACQRLGIPIDILQIPLPPSLSQASTDSSTVFLQQASDATSGIFIPYQYPSSTDTDPTIAPSQALLTYLLTSLLPTPSLRPHLILPTRIDVDFRAACFCHRRVIDTGYVCSICLSIFCSPPEGGICLTCGNELVVAAGGNAPVVVARKEAKKKKKRIGGSGGEGGNVGTPTAS
jgi:transcription initiation factor TFIIH subunit 3